MPGGNPRNFQRKYDPYENVTGTPAHLQRPARDPQQVQAALEKMGLGNRNNSSQQFEQTPEPEPKTPGRAVPRSGGLTTTVRVGGVFIKNQAGRSRPGA